MIFEGKWQAIGIEIFIELIMLHLDKLLKTCEFS